MINISTFNNLKQLSFPSRIIRFKSQTDPIPSIISIQRDFLSPKMIKVLDTAERAWRDVFPNEEPRVLCTEENIKTGGKNTIAYYSIAGDHIMLGPKIFDLKPISVIGHELRHRVQKKQGTLASLTELWLTSDLPVDIFTVTTTILEAYPPNQLLTELDSCFVQLLIDEIADPEKHNGLIRDIIQMNDHNAEEVIARWQLARREHFDSLSIMFLKRFLFLENNQQKHSDLNLTLSAHQNKKIYPEMTTSIIQVIQSFNWDKIVKEKGQK